MPVLGNRNVLVTVPNPDAAEKRVSSRKQQDRFEHVKSKITAEETRKFLERKKERELLRIKLETEKELALMSECTFKPKITEYRNRF